MSLQADVEIAVGDPAPDFSLRDQHGQAVTLSSFRGERAVLVVFYPTAFTRVCSDEVVGLGGIAEELDAAGVTPLVISCDSMFSQRVFAEQQGVSHAMLSDFWPHGAVAQAYGVFYEPYGCALRGTFLVDTEGVVRWKVVQGLEDVRDLDDVRKAIAAP